MGGFEPIARIRRARCRAHGCTHDLAICAQRAASCPNGVWGTDAVRPQPPPRVPRNHAVPRAQWPLWAKLLAFAAQPGDQGIGDIVARLIGPATSAAFKTWHLKTFGVPCGCTSRQVDWNIRYPLPAAH